MLTGPTGRFLGRRRSLFFFNFLRRVSGGGGTRRRAFFAECHGPGTRRRPLHRVPSLALGEEGFFFGIWLPNFLCPTPMATCSPCQSLGNFFFELLYLHDFLCLIAFFPENANLNCACTESSKKLIRKMLFMLLRVRKDRIQELARSFEHLTCEM
jgi:hypothetical protein